MQVACRALWDTGSWDSAIFPNKAILDMNLPENGSKPATVYGSPQGIRPIYVASLFLMPSIRIVDHKFVLLPDEEHFDVLIGMDIIHRGTFAIDNLTGKTTFTFALP
jgi:hypothetical protein